MSHPHGSVVLAPASFKGGVRPYLVVSNERRPFQGEEYTLATITTTQRPEALEVTPGTLAAGELARYPSYVNPWGLHVFRADRIEKRVAQAEKPLLERVSARIQHFVEPV
jgi:mRNA interferase MazF